jgi:hypothetical protein
MTDTTNLSALLDKLGMMTMKQSGWTQVSPMEMIWVGQPWDDDGAFRDVLLLKSHPRGLAITSGYIDDSTDPGDPAAVVEELGWPTVLPLAALMVLHGAIGSAVQVLADHEAAKAPGD